MRAFFNIFRIFYMFQMLGNMRYHHARNKQARDKQKAMRRASTPTRYHKSMAFRILQRHNNQCAKQWNKDYEARKRLIA